jgi:hypothetical protein
MSYATYSDFCARYVTKLTEAEVSSHLLPYAAARLEGALGPYFAVPFAPDNVTAKDLTLDLAYLLVLQRSKEPRDAAALAAAMEARLAALAQGKAAMVTAGGGLLHAQAAPPAVWAEGAAPVFVVEDAEREP